MPASFRREFMAMLDRTGLSPVGTPFEVQAKERKIFAVLGEVEGFGVRRLAEIEAWIRQPREYPVTKVNTILQEIKRRMAQDAAPKEQEYGDPYVEKWHRQKWEQYKNLDRDSLPLPAQRQHDSIKGYMEKFVWQT